jgi:hypothetical protein
MAILEERDARFGGVDAEARESGEEDVRRDGSDDV